MLAGLKDTWESFAANLGVIDQKKKEHYSKQQLKADLAKVDALEAKFAVHDWSIPDDVHR